MYNTKKNTKLNPQCKYHFFSVVLPEFLLMNIRGWANNLIFIYGSRWNARQCVYVYMLGFFFFLKNHPICESFILCLCPGKTAGKIKQIKI